MPILDACGLITKYTQLGWDNKKITEELSACGFTEKQIEQGFQQYQELSRKEDNSSEEALQPHQAETLISQLAADPKKGSSPDTASSSKYLNQVREDFSKKTVDSGIVGYFADILTGARNLKAFLLIFFLGLISASFLSFSFVVSVYPLIKDLPGNAQLFIEDFFPKELSIKINQGQVETNVQEPYYITISKHQLNQVFSPLSKDSSVVSKIRLLAIDTNATADDYERYQALALLTKNSLVYYNDDSIEIKPLRNIQKLEVNRQYLLNQWNKVNKDNRISKIIKYGLFVVPGGLLLVFCLFHLVSVISLCLILLLFARILKTKIPFKNIFALVSLIYFVSILILLPLRFFSFSLGQLSGLTNMFILGFCYWLLKRERNHFV